MSVDVFGHINCFSLLFSMYRQRLSQKGFKGPLILMSCGHILVGATLSLILLSAFLQYFLNDGITYILVLSPDTPARFFRTQITVDFLSLRVHLCSVYKIMSNCCAKFLFLFISQQHCVRMPATVLGSKFTRSVPIQWT